MHSFNKTSFNCKCDRCDTDYFEFYSLINITYFNLIKLKLTDESYENIYEKAFNLAYEKHKCLSDDEVAIKGILE